MVVEENDSDADTEEEIADEIADEIGDQIGDQFDSPFFDFASDALWRNCRDGLEPYEHLEVHKPQTEQLEIESDDIFTFGIHQSHL